MKKSDLKRFVVCAHLSVSYNEEAKEEFLRLGKMVARALAKELKLERGTYDVRVNRGGIAVSGEVTLHSDHFYVHLGQSCVMRDQFYWRLCRGRKDYTGLWNRHAKWTDLLDLPHFAANMSAALILDKEKELKQPYGHY